MKVGQYAFPFNFEVSMMSWCLAELENNFIVILDFLYKFPCWFQPNLHLALRSALLACIAHEQQYHFHDIWFVDSSQQPRIVQIGVVWCNCGSELPRERTLYHSSCSQVNNHMQVCTYMNAMLLWLTTFAGLSVLWSLFSPECQSRLPLLPISLFTFFLVIFHPNTTLLQQGD